MVKHNFAGAAVELFDMRMRELCCTLPRLTFSESAYAKQPQRIVQSVLYKWKHWDYIVCTVDATPTSLYAVFVVGMGSGWLL